jgi:hypothetical protein
VIVYERALRLRRADSVVPFTIRLENMRRAKRGINDGVAADLIVEGLGSNLDLADEAPLSFEVFHLDALGCILHSVFMLRGFLQPLERDIGWFEQDGFGWFGLPMLHDFGDPAHGIEFEREIEALIEERLSRRLEEFILAKRRQRGGDPAEAKDPGGRGGRGSRSDIG